MKKNPLSLIMMAMLLPAVVRAQFATSTENFNNNGTRAAQFLKFPVGARAIGMGESYAAVANDASALYWNPGGIGRLQKVEAHLTHANYLLDINHNFAGLVVPTAAGNLGFSAAVMSMGDEPVTTLADPDGESGVSWSASSFALGFTFSRALTDRFAAGITAKYIEERLFNSSAKTVAIDIGSLYETGWRGLKIGMAMTNFGGKMKLSGRDLTLREVDANPFVDGNIGQAADLQVSSWPLPLNFRVGIAFDLLRHGANALIIASDFNHPTDAEERMQVGAEYSFMNRFFLRGGYKFNYDEESFTVSGGVQFSSFAFDYAYRDFGILGSVPAFSLNLRL